MQFISRPTGNFSKTKNFLKVYEFWESQQIRTFVYHLRTKHLPKHKKIPQLADLAQSLSKFISSLYATVATYYEQLTTCLLMFVAQCHFL